MAGYWMNITCTNPEEKNHTKQKFQIRYSTSHLGFTVTKEVSYEIKDILEVAILVDKEQMKKEIHELLRLQ